MKVVHRDIKPANILLTMNQEILKLGDMNVSTIAKNSVSFSDETKISEALRCVISSRLCPNKVKPAELISTILPCCPVFN